MRTSSQSDRGSLATDPREDADGGFTGIKGFRGSQGSIHRIRGVLELTLKQNKAVGEGGRVTESARVPWCLRLVVIEVRTPWGAVVVVADWDVCSAVVRDDCVAKLHKPWGVCWVCHLLAHERVPWKRLDRIPECGGGGWQWRRR